VGGEQPIPIDVQVIAATNHDLKLKIVDKSFREDLYYRLNVITIEVPPLRQRREDIPLLIDFFLKKLSEEKRKSAIKIDRSARQILVEHDWPGNVRELHNIIERIVVLSDSDTISARDARDAIAKSKSDIETSHQHTLFEAREQFERDLILNTLISNDWKILETAAILGIDRSHLWKKMSKYGIEKQE